MKLKIFFLLLIFCLGFISIFSPHLVLADTNGDIDGSRTISTICPDGQACLLNPLGVDDPRIVIGNIIKAALGIVGSLALGVFIYGGFTWVISAGSEDKVKKGKDMIIWATFGLFIIFASYTLVSFVIGAVAG